MIAYQYNENKIFVGEVGCQKHPFRNEYLIPKDAVKNPPPNLEKGRWQFINEEWVEFTPKVFVDVEKIELISILNKKNPTKKELQQALLIMSKKIGLYE